VSFLEFHVAGCLYLRPRLITINLRLLIAGALTRAPRLMHGRSKGAAVSTRTESDRVA
jgi:hypothetical protein